MSSNFLIISLIAGVLIGHTVASECNGTLELYTVGHGFQPTEGCAVEFRFDPVSPPNSPNEGLFYMKSEVHIRIMHSYRNPFYVHTLGNLSYIPEDESYSLNISTNESQTFLLISPKRGQFYGYVKTIYGKCEEHKIIENLPKVLEIPGGTTGHIFILVVILVWFVVIVTHCGK